MTLEQDILRILTQAKTEIQANMARKGINASGRTSRGFRVEKTQDGMRLVLAHDETAQVECKPNGFGSVTVGTAPLATLEIGRPGGRVPRGFYYMIKQWTRDKGLTFASESDRQTFSYFTAKKIVREGTKRNRQHVQVYDVPLKKAEFEIKNDIRASVSNAITEAAKSNF